MHESKFGVGGMRAPWGREHTLVAALLHLHANDALVTLDGRPPYSLDTSLLRSETQRHPARG